MVKRFNEWFENNLDLPLTLNAPNTPRYATLVLSRLYFVRGIKQQFNFPRGCNCFADDHSGKRHQRTISAGFFNNPLQV